MTETTIKPVMTDEQATIIQALTGAATGIGSAMAIYIGTNDGSEAECLLKQLIRDLQATFK